MKIVDTDNFGGDYPDEKFLGYIDSTGKCAPMIFSKARAEAIAFALNDDPEGFNSPRYYKVVEDDYKLQPGFEP